MALRPDPTSQANAGANPSEAEIGGHSPAGKQPSADERLDAHLRQHNSRNAPRGSPSREGPEHGSDIGPMATLGRARAISEPGSIDHVQHFRMDEGTQHNEESSGPPLAQAANRGTSSVRSLSMGNSTE